MAEISEDFEDLILECDSEDEECDSSTDSEIILELGQHRSSRSRCVRCLYNPICGSASAMIFAPGDQETFAK